MLLFKAIKSYEAVNWLMSNTYHKVTLGDFIIIALN